MIKSLQSPWNILPFPLSAPPEDLYLFLERERKHTINPTPPQSGGREPPLLLGGRPAPPWRARPSEGPAVPVSQTLTLAGAADPAEGPPTPQRGRRPRRGAAVFAAGRSRGCRPSRRGRQFRCQPWQPTPLWGWRHHRLPGLPAPWVAGGSATRQGHQFRRGAGGFAAGGAARPMKGPVLPTPQRGRCFHHNTGPLAPKRVRWLRRRWGCLPCQGAGDSAAVRCRWSRRGAGGPANRQGRLPPTPGGSGDSAAVRCHRTRRGAGGSTIVRSRRPRRGAGDSAIDRCRRPRRGAGGSAARWGCRSRRGAGGSAASRAAYPAEGPVAPPPVGATCPLEGPATPPLFGAVDPAEGLVALSLFGAANPAEGLATPPFIGAANPAEGLVAPPPDGAADPAEGPVAPPPVGPPTPWGASGFAASRGRLPHVGGRGCQPSRGAIGSAARRGGRPRYPGRWRLGHQPRWPLLPAPLAVACRAVSPPVGRPAPLVIARGSLPFGR